MSMTRDEIIEAYESAVFSSGLSAAAGNEQAARDYELLKAGLDALRGPTREQVEKVWPGCEACKNAGLAIGEVQFYGPFEGPVDVSGNMQYCPNCGRPITPAAQEGQLERLEALKDGKGD